MSAELRERALAHLEEIKASSKFKKAKIQFRILEILVRTTLEGEEIPSGWHLTEKVYGTDAVQGGSEALYNRTKSALSALRVGLKAYYADRPKATVLRFELPERGYEVRIVVVRQEETKRSGSVVSGRWITVASVVAVIGLLSLGWIRLLETSRLPAAVAIEDGFPTLLDRKGRVVEAEIWSELLAVDAAFDPDREGHQQYPLERLVRMHFRAAVLPRSSERRYPIVAVASIIPEVPPGQGRLRLYDGRNGELIESLRIPYFSVVDDITTLNFHGEEKRQPADFHIAHMEVCDLDGDGFSSELVIGMRMADQFPFQVLALSVDVKAEEKIIIHRNYWSLGHLTISKVVDLDGDGQSEIVLCGTNNDFNMPVSIMLRLDEPDGRTCLGSNENIFEEILHLEENGFLIRFPRSELGKDPENVTIRGTATLEYPESFPEKFVVRVRDILPIPGSGKDAFPRDIYFDLMPNDEIITADFTPDADFYTTGMQKLIDRGAIEDDWQISETGSLELYGRDLGAQVEYWDGRDAEPEWKQLTPEVVRKMIRSPGSKRPAPP